MAKEYRKAVYVVLILCCFLMFGSSTAKAENRLPERRASEKNGWVKETGGCKYYIHGKCVKKIVKKINGEYYGFDGNGFMQRSKWKDYNGRRYYLTANGRAAKGIIKKINGEYYGFDGQGRMQKLKWKAYKGSRYYLTGNGKAARGIVKEINGEYYGFDSRGRMQKSKWKEYKGKKYYLTGSGRAYRNVLKKINGKYYYFGERASVFSGRSRNAVVQLARSWVGRNEADGSHRKIIDIYNRFPVHFREYKMKYNDPWCAATVSALAIELGYTSIIPVECSCRYMIVLAKRKGIWMEDDSYVPEPGDFILYDWQDTGQGDNTGIPDHIGTVESVSGNTIVVIEGNYQGVMKRRIVQVDGLHIRGYITPKYDVEQGASTAKTGYESSAVASDKKDYPFQITSVSVDVREHPAYGSVKVGELKTGSVQGIDRITQDGWGRLSNKAGWIRLKDSTKPLAPFSRRAKRTHGVRTFASYRYGEFASIEKGSWQGFCFVTRDNWAWLSNYAGWVKLTDYEK